MKILHVRLVDGSPSSEVFIMNLDGSDVTRISDNQTYDSNPVFSPDGRGIAYTGQRPFGCDLNPQVWVMEADGSLPRQLTTNGGVHP